ncbi:lipopolysaccharide-induced tumor necrosis factor-alpha factor homolog isoform X2 [Paramacrobiotus metropolitanus]|uniref:lipopolysaccharide-induced tumor necrosis factor-alpha factor homolog isoform X2 n=1 Tax=Paramacrobiotus metropolitanus TaxID=2943436 RepID=UPI0024461F3C|nr:lipopolysaccharide-induced tumor necrosis factor-alpha factor homolog isoform X2 [Paramacrobiotus metropolitanus]
MIHPQALAAEPFPSSHESSMPGQVPVAPVVQMVQLPVYAQAPAPGVMIYPDPLTTTCPHCNQTVTTVVEYRSGSLTYICMGIIAFLGGICGCCLIPTCIDSLKDAYHYCPSCQQYIGVYKRPLTRRYHYY